MGFKQRERKRNRKQIENVTTAKRRSMAKVARRYYLTPKVADHRCSHCGNTGAIAYRAADRKRACRACIDRLGIHAHESTTWIEAGRKPYAPVTTRFVDPETLRRAA